MVDDGKVRFEKVVKEQEEGMKLKFDGVVFMHCGFKFMGRVEVTYWCRVTKKDEKEWADEEEVVMRHFKMGWGRVSLRQAVEQREDEDSEVEQEVLEKEAFVEDVLGEEQFNSVPLGKRKAVMTAFQEETKEVKMVKSEEIGESDEMDVSDRGNWDYVPEEDELGDRSNKEEEVVANVKELRDLQERER